MSEISLIVNLNRRSRIVRTIRTFFHQRGFIEVETPLLVSSPGQEPHLDVLELECHPPGCTSARRYLQTSPEYAMKRLLAEGMKRVFQICRVFRDGEAGAHHQIEFTMLEWYRAEADYHVLMGDCEGLLRAVARGMNTYPEIRYGDGALDLRQPFQRLTVREAFHRHAGIDLPRTEDVTELRRALHGPGFDSGYQQVKDFDELFFRIFLERVEPKLGIERPTILTEYPASMAALARIKADDPTVAERFELYAGGLELANAFSELNDPVEQRRRFLSEQQHRRRLGKPVHHLDEAFLGALDRMPEAAGIALGIDRLAMLFCGADSIQEVIAFPEEWPDG